VYDDTKHFVYNYGKHVVLPMVMEHAVNKLFIKNIHTNIRRETDRDDHNPRRQRHIHRQN
jgi:hypothetical protein